MEKDNFYKNSFMLTLSNLTTGILGFMFSIILSRKLGAEGMGLYGLIMPVYNLFICLITAGIVAAISRLSAIYYNNREFGNLRKTIKTTFIFNFIWAFFVSSLVFIFALSLSKYIIKDERTLYALRITCPAMIFIALSNILKGYFYGISKITIPAIIDIFEKAIRIGVLLLISEFFNLNSLSQTVTVAYIALCLGEFVSLFLLYIYYIKDIRNLKGSIGKTEGRAQLLFNVLVISLPLCLNGVLSSILSTLSTLIVPRRLVAAGFLYNEALSMIGKFTGMTMNIVFFPMIVIGSISTVLIPDLSQTMSKKDFYSMEKRINEVLRISFLLGICALIICSSIPDKLGLMFFKREDLSEYIAFASLCAPLVYTSASTYGILNGLGKQNIILRNSLIISLFEVLLLYVLTSIKAINIFGYGITTIITSILTLIFNLKEINSQCSISFSFSKFLLYAFVAFLLYTFIGFLRVLIPESIGNLKYIFIIFLGFSLLLFPYFGNDK